MYVATCLFKRTRSHGLVYTTITKSAPKRPPCCHVWCLSVRKRPLRHSLTLVSVDNATKFGKKRVMNPATETPPVLPLVVHFCTEITIARLSHASFSSQRDRLRSNINPARLSYLPLDVDSRTSPHPVNNLALLRWEAAGLGGWGRKTRKLG